jgi:hypothetical protein
MHPPPAPVSMMRVRLMDASKAAYAPSWVDRLTDRVDALPFPAWAAYLGLLVVVALAGNLAVWLDGSLDFGQPDVYQLSLGFYVAIALGGIHYLDLAASQAWRTFRPVLQVDDETAAAMGYQLTTMPARTTLAWTLIGLAANAVFFVSLYGTEVSIERTPVTLIENGVVDAVALVLTVVLGYHTLRQLRLIDALHRQVERIDLLDIAPLHAFSRVSAATGILLLALVYVAVLTDPASSTNVGLVAGLGITVALAVACFVVPLYGMHTRIAAEKARRLEETNRRLDRVLAELDRRTDLMDLTEADAFNKHLASVIAQRQVVSAVPTWPWQAETLRGFVTAVALPVALWFLYRFLEGQLA